MGYLTTVFAALSLTFFGQPHIPQLPPVDYTGPTYREIEVSFKSPIAVHIACGGDFREFQGQMHQIFACAGVGKNWIIMPDPCLYPDENYARLMCHELGHTKGWPSNHPDAVP